MKIISRKNMAQAVLGWITFRDPDAPHLKGRAYMNRAIADLAEGRLAFMATLAHSTVPPTGWCIWEFTDGSSVEGTESTGWEDHAPA